MSPPNPKRPPRSSRPPEPASRQEDDLPFDDDEVAPLQADDPRPQRVPQFPAGSRRARRGAGGSGREGRDRELPSRFTSGEYEDPGHVPVFLYVERGPGAGQLLPIKQGTLVLGRSSTSDLRLQHPSISRRHAQLTRRGEHLTLKDLGSQNGTYVNRTRVTTELELLAGDEISLGNALLRIRGPGAPGERPASEGPAAAPFLAGWSSGRLTLIAALAGSLVVLLTFLTVRLAPSRSRPARAEARAETPQAPEAPKAVSPVPPPEAERDTSPPPEPVKPVRPASGFDAQSIARTGGAPSPKPAARERESVLRSPPRGALAGAVVVEGQEPEAAALEQYEKGQLDAALALARRAHLEPLSTRLGHFQTELRAGQSALKAGDMASARQHLAKAAELDQLIAEGWGAFSAQLREGLRQANGAQ